MRMTISRNRFGATFLGVFESLAAILCALLMVPNAPIPNIRNVPNL